MRKFIYAGPLLLAVLLTGCTGKLTNLTPQYQTRNANGLYPVAVAFQTRQQSLRWDSIKPYVMVGDQAYLMRKMPYMSNRWETLVPVAAGQNTLDYRYKLDWQYNAIPVPQNDSLISAPQTLHIIEQ